MSAVERTSAYGRALAARTDDVEDLLRAAPRHGVDLAAARTALVDLGPLVEPLVAALPARAAGELVVTLVATVLDLTAAGRWRAGRAERFAVEQVLVTVPTWCAARPSATVRALVAAAPAVLRGGDLDRWAALLRCAPRGPVSQAPADVLTEATVRDAVLVAGWRAGLARYRTAALAAAGRLPDGLARAMLDLGPETDLASVLEAHRRDRWTWPGTARLEGVLLRAGGSRALGGPWLERPLAVPGGPTGWAVLADGSAWAVLADVHGHALVPITAPTAAPGPQVPHGDRLPVPWQDEVTGLVPDPSDAGTLLVSRAHSYAVDVVRTRAGGSGPAPTVEAA